MSIQTVKVNNIPISGPYSQAIKANGFIFVSGCIPQNPQTHQIIKGNIKEATKLALTNLESVLKAGNSELTKIVKVNIYLSDMSLYHDVNQVYEEVIETPFPARTTVAVKDLPMSVDLEIEAIALYQN